MSYPALKNLGINRPHEISGYTLSSESGNDILRIRYSRQKGSLLPTSKRFKFPRHPMAGTADAGEFRATAVSPALDAALTELSQLLDKNKTVKERKAELVEDIKELESLLKAQLSDLRSEIEKL